MGIEMKDKKEWELVGHVAVDSGQLMVCDPSYVDGCWERDQAPELGHAPMVLTAKGRARWPGLKDFRHSWPFPWGNYDEVCPDLGMSINDAHEKGLIQKLDRDYTRGFDYKSVCSVSHRKGPRFGQLLFPAGHEGAGVCFASGYGDGYYPVFGRRNEDGRVVEVRIIMEMTPMQAKAFGVELEEGVE